MVYPGLSLPTPDSARKATGIALTVVGAFATIPLAIAILSKKDQLRDIKSVA